MKPDDACVESEVFGVVTANSFHVELFPTVTVFRIGRVRIFFSQRRDVRFLLFVTGIDARAGRVEITFDAIDTRGLDRVQIDKRVVANDDGLVVLDKTDAAHIRGEAINLVHTCGGLQAIVGFRKVEQQKLIRGAGLVFRFLDVHAAHKVAAINQILRQMMTDKTARARYQYFCLL